MSLACVQSSFLFFDLKELLLFLDALLEDLLYHVGLLSLVKLRVGWVGALVGCVLPRSVEDGFFASVDHILYLFRLVFMGCYFFLQF